MNRKHRYIDETGEKHNGLKVLRYAWTENKGAVFECLCDCGNITYASGTELRSGNKKSCGCSRCKPRKPKATYCIICGSEKVYCKNMCYRCYRKQWDEKKKEEMERYL